MYKKKIVECKKIAHAMIYWFKALVVIRIGVQTPFGTWAGLGTQPRYEACGDLQLKIVKMQWLTLVSEVVLLRMAQSWPWDS